MQADRESSGLRASTLILTRRLILFSLVALSLAGAQQMSPQQVVDRAIEHAGGWDAWVNTKTIQFRKSIVRYNDDGSVKETCVQFHKYQLHPSPMMRIEWESNGSKGVFINDGQFQHFLDLL